MPAVREVAVGPHYLTVTFAIPMHWFPWRSLPPEDQRRARLLRVLHSAVTQTRYAKSYPRQVERIEQLPAVELLEFLRHTERYAWADAKPVRERLLYPLGEAPRTAVAGRNVEESRRVRCFPSLQSDDLAAFAPQSIAAPLDAFRAAIAENAPPLPLRNAVIVFTGILEGPLTPGDGDCLWQRYQVPVFEQFLGLDGELLAWECEIHHGLHVREQAAYFEGSDQGGLFVSFLANPRLPVLRLETGLTGRIVAEACPCGDPSPRLVDLRRRAVRRATSAGVIAVAAAI